MTSHTISAPAPCEGGGAGAVRLTRSQRRAARTLAAVAVFIALWCVAMLAIPFIADTFFGP